MSHEINETDLERLSTLITTHLQCYMLYFGTNLKPKHHFLTHYTGVIRSLGPVIKFWAMRMEAKHQFFKRIVYKTNNFINIKKTLAKGFLLLRQFCMMISNMEKKVRLLSLKILANIWKN